MNLEIEEYPDNRDIDLTENDIEIDTIYTALTSCRGFMYIAKAYYGDAVNHVLYKINNGLEAIERLQSNFNKGDCNVQD